MASGLRALGLPVGPVVTMERSGRSGAREALKRIQGADRVKGEKVKSTAAVLRVLQVLFGGRSR